MKNRRSRSYSFSYDFIKAIGDKSEETGIPASQLIERACYETYPELKNKKGKASRPSIRGKK